MTLSTSCRVCAYPTTIAETAPRICPKCLLQPQKTRETLELRIVEREEALAQAWADFDRIFQAQDLETRARYDRLIEARTACLSNEDKWAAQRRREAKTLEQRDALSRLLQAEQVLTAQAAAVAAAIDAAREAIWDLDAATGITSWEMPAYIVERRLRLGAERPTGQPQLLGLATAAPVDPRPDLTPLPAAPPRAISRCDSCKAPIVWATTLAGKKCPYDVDEQGNKTDVSHFATCPNAKSHSKRQPKAKKQAVAA